MIGTFEETELKTTRKENKEDTPQLNENGNSKQLKNSPSVSFVEKIRNFFRFFTVEPFLLCYIIPIALSSLAVSKLNMEKACRVDLNYTEYICKNASNGDINDNITLEAQVAAIKEVTKMTAWQSIVQSSVPAIMILFVGAWSDRTGNRKPLMLIPTIGEIISSSGLLLTVYFFDELPLWFTALVEALPTALSGGQSIALMGAYSYIADVTTLESRTFRIGVVAVIVTLGIPLGTSLSGVLTESLGYYGIFTINICLYVFGFVHTWFSVHDVRSRKTEGTFLAKIKEFFHPRNLWDTISLLFLSPKKQIIKIILVICVHVVIVGPVAGEGNLMYYYTLNRYSMDIVDFSLFTTYAILMGTAGTFVAVTIFSKWLKLHDSFIGIIATASKTGSHFVYGLAPTQKWFFAGPVFDFFGNSGVTAIRSIGTKIVDPEQVGKMCSLIGFVEALIPVVYSPMYSKIYENTIDVLPGAMYFVGGVMTIPAFFIFITLFVLQRREQKDIVTNPAAKEMHAHDNAVTTL